jgi:hypothetical protein
MSKPIDEQCVRYGVTPRENKTVALLEAADAILIRDAKRRRGKRFAKRARRLIATGRYR